MIVKYLIGSDPELFLFDTKLKKYIPGIGLIGGSKNQPLDIGNGCKVQEDGVMAELNVPPTTDSDEFYNSIKYCTDYLKKILPPHIELRWNASAEFDPKFLKSKQARTMGCDPDFNAWSGDVNDIVDNSAFLNLRCSGGHIHIGYDKPDFNVNFELVKLMDLFLGVPSVFLDKDKLRKKLYGKAGAMRHQLHGVEYRVLSNFWLVDKKSIDWVFNAVSNVIRAYNEGLLEKVYESGQNIIEAINDSNEEITRKLIEKYQIDTIGTLKLV